MVSLWPWKKDDNSPSSFEKTLSTLSTKITNTQAQLDRTRASHRRLKVLSTLYLSFAYLVYAIVALLVVGWKNMGAYEWSGMAGGPVLIYLVRTIASTVYELRIESLNSKLKDQQAVRAKTIQKLKDATRYDSTMELLEKYGGGEVRAKGKKKSKDETADENETKSPGRQQQKRPDTGTRTNMPIPATANIQRHNMGPSHAGTPQQSGTGPYSTPQQHRGSPPNQQALEPSAEFSPNAFDTARPPPPAPGQQQYDVPSHWYDRIMDLLLGEDETAAKNRLVLICKRCRLVNGQAPPGTNSLAELGMWKCMGCGVENGEVDEGRRLVKEVLDRQGEGTSSDGGEESDVVDAHSVDTKKNDEKGDAKGGEDAPAVKRKAKGRK
ncbi:hypothetical protein N0V93_008951 [Gnomoniopsis smithogilvyi]|uniref:Endoplasmic reticulum junction formation protein lunapark n=1 Tax=Gnomoniopsis smithogilvyi TaxID=1191159 RepID=A0A9W8YIS1_9PEZI|nr:hypothetical protein N0V93_008951 [Gnomoniopsis smithogilvyi]